MDSALGVQFFLLGSRGSLDLAQRQRRHGSFSFLDRAVRGRGHRVLESAVVSKGQRCGQIQFPTYHQDATVID